MICQRVCKCSIGLPITNWIITIKGVLIYWKDIKFCSCWDQKSCRIMRSSECGSGSCKKTFKDLTVTQAAQKYKVTFNLSCICGLIAEPLASQAVAAVGQQRAFAQLKCCMPELSHLFMPAHSRLCCCDLVVQSILSKMQLDCCSRAALSQDPKYEWAYEGPS